VTPNHPEVKSHPGIQSRPATLAVLYLNLWLFRRSYVYQHLTNKKEAEATKRGDKLSREVGVPVPWSIETKISDAATSLVRRTCSQSS